MTSMMKTPALLFTLATTLLVGCAGQPAETTIADPCPLPSAVRLAPAIEQAKATLATAGCEKTYNATFERLLTVGEGDPDTGNRTLFREFIIWSYDQGLVGKLQAKTLNTRYFYPTFVSLPDDYNNCAASCPALDDIERDMGRELVDKHRGMAKILGDQAAYNQADAQYNGVLLLLEAACQACEADNGR